MRQNFHVGLCWCWCCIWCLSLQFQVVSNQVAENSENVTTTATIMTTTSTNVEARRRQRQRLRVNDQHEHDDLDPDLDDDLDLNLDEPPRKNYTLAEVSAWLHESEQTFLNRTSQPHPMEEHATLSEDDVEEFLAVLHQSAEIACALAKGNGSGNKTGIQIVAIRGQIVTLRVEYITPRLQTELARKKRDKTAVKAGPNAGDSVVTTRLEVELSDSLLQYCSEVDEGLVYVCHPLCLATVRFTRDLLSSQHGEPSWEQEIWDSFLISAEEGSAIIVDPENLLPAPAHKPLVFWISPSRIPPDHNVQCLRWNYSFWDNSTCLESRRISATVVECRCLQFGYLKIQYTPSTVNESQARCPFLQFSVANTSTATQRDVNLTSIRHQLRGQLNLSEVWTIEDLQFTPVAKNRTWTWIQFRLNHSGSGCAHGEWRPISDKLDELLQSQNLTLHDSKGRALLIPSQRVQIIDSEEDERMMREIEQISLVAAIVIGVVFGAVLLFSAVVAIRKYRRKRQNSVKVLKRPIEWSVVSVAGLQMHANGNQIHSGTGIRTATAAPGEMAIGSARPPKTNVRRMSFSTPDQNQNLETGIGIPANARELNLEALPNAAIDEPEVTRAKEFTTDIN